MDKGIIPVEQRPGILESRKETSGLMLEVVEYLEQKHYAQPWKPPDETQYTYAMKVEFYRLGNDQSLADKNWPEVKAFILAKGFRHGFIKVILEINNSSNYEIKLLNPDYGDEFCFSSQITSYLELKLEDRPGMDQVGLVKWPGGTGLPARLVDPQY